MNINEEIQKAADKFIEAKLPELVEKKVESMVSEVLKDVFSSYGPMAKEIKKKIEEKLDINLQRFTLIDYNHIVSKAISDYIGKAVDEQAMVPIMKMVHDTIGYIETKEINLSEIHQWIKDWSQEYNSSDSEGEFTFIVEENPSYKWITVSIDIDKGKKPYECDIQFTMSTRDNVIFSFQSSSYRSPFGEITPAKLTGLSHVERKVFRLYAAMVKINVDETDFYNTWERYDD